MSWTYRIPEHLYLEPLLQTESGEPDIIAVHILVEAAGRVQNPDNLARGITWCRLYRGRYAKMFKVAKRTVSRSIDRLTDAGFFRRHDIQGQRKIEVILTNKGRTVIEEGLGPAVSRDTGDTCGQVTPHTTTGDTKGTRQVTPQTTTGVSGVHVRVTNEDDDGGEAAEDKNNNDPTSGAKAPSSRSSIPGAAPQTPVVFTSQAGATPPAPPEGEDQNEDQDQEPSEVEKFIDFYLDWYNFTQVKDDSQSLSRLSSKETETLEAFFATYDVNALFAAVTWIEAQRLAKKTASNGYEYYACKRSNTIQGFVRNWTKVTDDIETVIKDHCTRSPEGDLEVLRNHLFSLGVQAYTINEMCRNLCPAKAAPAVAALSDTTDGAISIEEAKVLEEKRKEERKRLLEAQAKLEGLDQGQPASILDQTIQRAKKTYNEVKERLASASKIPPPPAAKLQAQAKNEAQAPKVRSIRINPGEQPPADPAEPEEASRQARNKAVQEKYARMDQIKAEVKKLKEQLDWQCSHVGSPGAKETMAAIKALEQELAQLQGVPARRPAARPAASLAASRNGSSVNQVEQDGDPAVPETPVELCASVNLEGMEGTV